MQKLTANWFSEGLLDFEYKKYMLLAYLKHVSSEFAQVRLYPSLSELLFHYQNLDQFYQAQQQLHDQMATRLGETDLHQVEGKPLLNQPSHDIEEIASIVSYALPNIKTHLKEGKDIYDFIEAQLLIEPVGISPLYRKEGYLFLRINRQPLLKVYDYRVIFFENTDANYYGISFTPIDTYQISLAWTYEAIKLDLVRSHNKYPNPATYLIFTHQAFPEEASLLPVAKRKMLSYLKQMEG